MIYLYFDLPNKKWNTRWNTSFILVQRNKSMQKTIFKAILYISCKINPLTGNQTLWRPVTFSPGSLQSALEWVLDGLWWLVQEREQYGWQFADWSYKAISMWCCVTVWLLKPGYLEVDKIIQSQYFLEKQRILKIFCNGPITFKYISTIVIELFWPLQKLPSFGIGLFLCNL